ncbi:uncharacterized protein LOC103729813 [Nannospalax galili]|uniref:uncharacterized protein LOC103729813 n=1 Tax=Nannospalax galili TaxID=1026970 RepID=UPI000819D25C|nr:uncharacterized protein LOC103729813 [Nannospalax galili]
MSEQEEPYSHSGFLMSSSEQQSRVKPGGTQRPTENKDRVLVFQHSQGKHHEENINLSQEYHIMVYEMKLKDELLKNKSIEYESLKNLTERKRYHGKHEIISNCLKSTGKHFEGHWFCCGTKCYYFIMDSKNWNGCRQTCRKCSLSLLKIDDSDERDLLRSQVNGNSHWIGLSYDKRERKWKWIDSGSSNLSLTALNLNRPTGMCAFLTSTRIDDSDCGKTYPCICEKRVDTFCDSGCNKKERVHSALASRRRGARGPLFTSADGSRSSIGDTEKRLEGHLFCYGTKCYYAIMESKTWIGCRQICNECSLSLLKIYDSDERDFLWSQVNGDSYWIGLSYDKQEEKWKWIDSGSSNLNLTSFNLQRRVGMCAFFTSTRIVDSDCGKTYPCICEKRMVTFSDSVCNKKESPMQSFDTSLTSKMSEQEELYSNSGFLKSSSEQQSRVKPAGTQGPKETEDRECSISWLLIAVVLGILCFLLLVVIALWATQRKLTDTMYNYNYNFRYNPSMEIPSALIIIMPFLHVLIFIMHCDFLWSQVNGDSYWIGLSYDKQEEKWKWIDSGSSNLDLTALNLNHSTGMCAFLTSTRIDNTDCSKSYPCICEKRMDTFSDSVCNKKEM